MPASLERVGGRLTEILVAGQRLASFAGSHDGVSGDIAPVTLSRCASLVGVRWAAQYIVAGGGFVDLSQAVFGIIGSP